MEKSAVANTSWSKTLGCALAGSACAGVLAIGFLFVNSHTSSPGSPSIGTPVFYTWVVLSPVLAVFLLRIVAGTWSPRRMSVAALLTLIPSALIFGLIAVFTLSHGG